VTDLSLQPILALLGQPVAGNPTQYMMEKAFAHHGLDCRYLSLLVAPEDLAEAVGGIRAMGFRGGNCAAPHKQAIVAHLDRLMPAADLSGVVNCIWREGRQLIGENTEGKGLVESLRRRIDPAQKKVVLLGAGKVARAIAAELAMAGAAEVIVVNRSEPAGRQLVEMVHGKLNVPATLAVWEGDYQVPPDTEVLIHATSIGESDPDARVPIVAESLNAPMVVADVTLNPPATRLLALAAERGCPTVDGLEMFLAQAAIDFKLWTGVEVNADVIREAVEEYLEI
jgi:shikimate dehydrogenase